jgi:hypothetical protein
MMREHVLAVSRACIIKYEGMDAGEEREGRKGDEGGEESRELGSMEEHHLCLFVLPIVKVADFSTLLGLIALRLFLLLSKCLGCHPAQGRALSAASQALPP